jgi:hypothetical protein
MLTVTFTFEEELDLDANDPLGDLSISDGRSVITIKTTFLDSWLVALIEAHDKRNEDHMRVEVAEEPFFLRIDVDSSGLLTINDGKLSLSPQSRDAFYRALRTVSESFLRAVLVLPDGHRNTFLEPIKRFVSAGLFDANRN